MMFPKPVYKKRKSQSNPIPLKLLEEVWRRDRNECQYCGAYCPGEIPHHIAYGGTGRQRVHQIENLITLCLKHHDEVHSSKAMREWAENWSRKRYGNVIDKLLEAKWSGEK